MSRVRFPWRPGRRVRLPEGFQEVRWRSQVLGRRMSLALYLPPGYYYERSDRRYPVLYVLHGSGHDWRTVLLEVRPQDRITALGAAILVIPDGNQGWWLDSPRVARSQYGQYLMELVRLVDRRYRTLAGRGARGICGFSMGGYGAMLLAALYPATFGAASSLLGPLDILQMFPDYYRLRLLLGSERDTWQRFNPASLVQHLTATQLCFCTAEDAPDLPQNESFASALRVLHVPFQYRVYPGGHDTSFVRQHVGEHWMFHRKVFDRSIPG